MNRSNREIIFTNSRGAKKYRQYLGEKKIKCTEFPLITVKPLSLPPDLSPLIEATVVVFTSINGILFFKQAFEEFNKPHLLSKDFWTVGLESKNTLETWIKKKAYVPNNQHGLGLARSLTEFYSHSQKIVLFQGRLSDAKLALMLRQNGHAVTKIEVYNTHRVETLTSSIIHKIQNGTLVYLASPSAVMALADMLDIVHLKKSALMAIGPTTTKKIFSYGIKPIITLASPSYQNTIRAIEKYFDILKADNYKN